VVGSGLEVDAELIQLTAFAREAGGDGGAGITDVPVSRIARPTRRWR